MCLLLRVKVVGTFALCQLLRFHNDDIQSTHSVLGLASLWSGNHLVGVRWLCGEMLIIVWLLQVGLTMAALGTVSHDIHLASASPQILSSVSSDLLTEITSAKLFHVFYVIRTLLSP